MQEIREIVAAAADEDAGQYTSHPGIGHVDAQGRKDVGTCDKCQ